jgi:hypothetical protein
MWGLVGAASATVLAAFVAAAASFGLGFANFEVRWPYGHFARIAVATLAMLIVLHFRAGGETYAGLVLHVATGAAVYLTALALLYMPELSAFARLSRVSRTDP